MAEQKKCNLCGARFDVPGAVGDLDEHMKSFHPGKPKSAKPESGGEPTPAEAMEALQAAIARIDELEATVAELSTENEQLKAAQGDGSAGNGEGQSSGKKLENMTTAELEEVAKAEGVDLSGATTNAERAEAIAKARDAAGS